MASDIRIREVRRKQIDDEKLALAFLLLAKAVQGEVKTGASSDQVPGDAEAA